MREQARADEEEEERAAAAAASDMAAAAASSRDASEARLRGNGGNTSPVRPPRPPLHPTQAAQHADAAASAARDGPAAPSGSRAAAPAASYETPAAYYAAAPPVCCAATAAAAARFQRDAATSQRDAAVLQRENAALKSAVEGAKQRAGEAAARTRATLGALRDGVERVERDAQQKAARCGAVTCVPFARRGRQRDESVSPPASRLCYSCRASPLWSRALKQEHVACLPPLPRPPSRRSAERLAAASAHVSALHALLFKPPLPPPHQHAGAGPPKLPPAPPASALPSGLLPQVTRADDACLRPAPRTSVWHSVLTQDARKGHAST